MRRCLDKVLSRTSIADEMSEEHRRRVLAIDRQTTAAKSGGRAFASCLAARKKRQRQNRLPDLIFYDHHQSRIVIVRIVVAIFSQLSDCVLGMRKCRRYIRQVCASRVIIDPCPSAYRKEILRHSTFAHYVEDQTALPRPDGSFQSGTPKPSDSWLRREAAMISRLAGDGGGKRRVIRAPDHWKKGALGPYPY